MLIFTTLSKLANQNHNQKCGIIAIVSDKFFVIKLHNEKYIQSHYQEVIDYYFSNDNVYSPLYEHLISKHFFEYINDDRLYQLSISSLYRIQHQYLYGQENEDEDEIKI